MAITSYELITSRVLNDNPRNPTARREWILLGSTDEDEIRVELLSLAGPTYLNIWILGVTVEPLGPSTWKGTAEYGVPEFVPGTELPSQVANDGSNPGGPGADGGSPPSEPGDEEPLGPEYSFTTAGGTEKIFTAKEQMFSGFVDGEPGAPNFRRAIAPDETGTPQGVDVPARRLEWSTTRKVKAISRKYLRTLGDLTGTINDRTWFGWPEGNVRFDGADGQYRDGEGWSITYRFAVARTAPEDEEIAPGLTLADPKRGWDLIDVHFRNETDTTTNRLVQRPYSYHVYRVFDEEDFRKLGIGG